MIIRFNFTAQELKPANGLFCSDSKLVAEL